MRILQSSVERLLYALLFLMFVAIIAGIPFQINLYRRLDTQQRTINSGVQSIKEEQQCIASFFLQPDRQNITVANLKVCNDVVKNLPR